MSTVTQSLHLPDDMPLRVWTEMGETPAHCCEGKVCLRVESHAMVVDVDSLVNNGEGGAGDETSPRPHVRFEAQAGNCA